MNKGTLAALLAMLLLGGAIGVGATLAFRGGGSETKRTAPEIVKALRVTACADLSETFPTQVLSPIRSSTGDWYVACRYDFDEGPVYSCYRVKADTLEAIFLEGGRDGRPCETLPDWPKQ